MIPGAHRLKGGALQLGADEAGLPGRPFGTWTDQTDQDDERDPAQNAPAEPHC
ncbi:hypothetical protein ACFYWX_40360 [Streptomyces sp. NPDC002888]|uniref:hypothetical protein n=1 Tax=Streptomyces sp. NPDC002888 TaxID=3364668 RepID=UPI003689FA9A